MSTPLISVAISTYNHERYIKKCVDSVLSQGIDDMEIIILDDCSTDGTLAVLDAYAAIPYVSIKTREHNVGPRHNNSDALMCGSGRFHVWFHGDDYMLPGHLKRMLEGLLANDHCSLGYAPPQYVDEEGEDIASPDHPGRRSAGYAGGRNELADLLRYDNYLVPSSVVFRRSALLEVGNFHPTIPGADWDLYTRFAIHNDNFFYSDVKGIAYRVHPNQVSVDFYAGIDSLKAHLHVVNQALQSDVRARLDDFRAEILHYLDQRIAVFGARSWTLNHAIAKVRFDLSASPARPGQSSDQPALSVVVAVDENDTQVQDRLNRIYDALQQSKVGATQLIAVRCRLRDDGSTGEPELPSRAFCTELPIDCIEVSPNGLADAWNIGLEHASSAIAVMLSPAHTFDIAAVSASLAWLHEGAQRGIVPPALLDTHTQGLMLRRSTWIEYGGFSEILQSPSAIVAEFVKGALLGLRTDADEDRAASEWGEQLVAQFSDGSMERALIDLHHAPWCSAAQLTSVQDTVARMSGERYQQLLTLLDRHPENVLLMHCAELVRARVEQTVQSLAPLADRPLVSVMVPTMNRSDLLADTLASLVAQTYTNWEAIVINDCGEGDLDWVESVDEQQRIRLIHNDRQTGCGGARNKGISVCRGSIVCYLDDDDVYLPDHLETIVNAMAGQRVMIAYTEAEYVHEVLANGERRELGRFCPYSGVDYSLRRLHEQNFIPVICWAHRIELVSLLGNFERGLSAFEDWDLLLRYTRVTEPVHIGKITTEVRARSESESDNMTRRERKNFPSLYRRVYARNRLEGDIELLFQRRLILAKIDQEHRRLALGRDANAYQDWQRKTALLDSQAQYMAERMMLDWALKPTIHILTRFSPGDENALADLIDSLDRQLYRGWGLSVISTEDAPDTLFAELPNMEWLTTRAPLGTVLNRQVAETAADWVMFVELGTALAPHALFSMVDQNNVNPYWTVMYADEDRIGVGNERYDPLFKPAFNRDLLRSTAYMGAGVVFRRDVLLAVGGFGDAEGAYVYDAVLRAVEHMDADTIGHIADVLFHRVDAGQRNRDEDTIAENRRQALQRHLQRQGVSARVNHGTILGAFEVDYAHRSPGVSILLRFNGDAKALSNCLTSLMSTTDYANYEVLVLVDERNLSVSVDDPAQPDAAELTSLLADHQRVRMMGVSNPTDLRRSTEEALRHASGELIVFFDIAIRCVHAQWLSKMVSHCARQEVGIVAPKIVRADGAVVHGGIILGMADTAGYVFAGEPYEALGYMGRLQLTQNYSAVSSLCMMCSRERYLSAGGFGTRFTSPRLAELDLCLRVSRTGADIVWTPAATVCIDDAYETTTVTDVKQIDAFTMEHIEVLSRDPAHNPNLSLLSVTLDVESELVVPWSKTHRPRPRIWGFPLNDQGVGQYRVVQPLEALDRAALAETALLPEHERVSRVRLPSLCELSRVEPNSLLIQHGFTDLFLKWLPKYRKLGDLRMIFGLDDNLFDIPAHNPRGRQMPKDLDGRLRQVLSYCDKLIVTTQPLVDVYGDYIDDIAVIPNHLASWLWPEVEPTSPRAGKPRVGWVGAQQHGGDLALLAPVMEALKDEVDWVLMGMCPRELRPYLAEYHQPVAFDKYPEKLQSLDLDLALAPLEINAFNECKSDLRILEYGAMAWPVIASDIHPYRNKLITLVENDSDKWIRTIRERLNERRALAEQGRALYRWVRANRLIENNVDDWLEAVFSPACLKWHEERHSSHRIMSSLARAS